VKGGQFLPRGAAWLMMQHLRGKTLRGQFPDETLVTIRTERMAIAEPVAGNGFSGDDGDRSGHGRGDYHGLKVTDCSVTDCGDKPARVADNSTVPRTPQKYR